MADGTAALQEELAKQRELAALMEWFQAIEDSDSMGGRAFRPSLSARRRKAERLRVLLRELGIAGVPGLEEALLPRRSVSVRASLSVEALTDALEASEAGFGEGVAASISPDTAAALGRASTPSAEDEFIASQREVLSQEQHPADEELGAVSYRSGAYERRNNILYHLFQQQAPGQEGRCFGTPIASFQDYSRLMLARMIYHGYATSSRAFPELLAEYFSEDVIPDSASVQRLLYPATFRHPGILDEPDPRRFLARTRRSARRVLSLTDQMATLYTDVVRACRRNVKRHELPDIPLPDVRAFGLDAYRRRIANCYRTAGNIEGTARAFRVLEWEMRAYIRGELGLSDTPVRRYRRRKRVGG